MIDERRARDIELLDKIDRLERSTFEGRIWRVVREGRDVLQGGPIAARWDPGLFDALYTSQEKDGAITEIHFHLSRQPVFPSKIDFYVHQLSFKSKKLLRLPDAGALKSLGINFDKYGEIDYARSQEIADAAYFLGFDAILAPSARYNCSNIIIFTDRVDPADLGAIDYQVIDWESWRKR